MNSLTHISELSHDIPFQNRLKQLSKYMFYLVISFGMTVLLGWTFDLESIKHPFPHLSSMNPTSALLFIILGASFLSLTYGKSKFFQRMGITLTIIISVVVIIRMLALSDVLNIQIDYFIFPRKMDLASKIAYNRMSPYTSICFLLNAITIVILQFRIEKKFNIAHYLSLIVISIALFSILAYLYRVQAFHGLLIYIPMAIHTALCFLLVSTAILFSSPERGIMGHLTTVYSGSTIARFMIPAAIIIPIVFGYLRLLGHWNRIFSTEFGVTILMLSITIVFVMLIVINSISLNRKDKQKKTIELQLEMNMVQLRESEEKFQKAFESSAAGISITRISDGVYLNVNDSFVEMTGYTKEELIGHSSSELGLVININKREKVLEELRENGSVKNLELSIQHKSGKLLEILSSIETIWLKGDKYALNIIFDISDRKKMETQLETANKELESFSYSVSHDLRAPLRAISGFSELLGNNYADLLDTRGKSFLKIINDNVNKMNQLIDDLLSFSRLKGKTINKTELDMNQLVKVVLTDFNRIIPHSAHINVGKLDPAKGDYALIKQVLINLISNAIKYSSKKTVPQIDITSEVRGNNIIYSIKDNGEGFDMKYVNKLFNVFQRLHTDYEFEGTGVGLAIVQRIIDKHKGKVWAEAELGLGAKFSFALPLN